MIVVTFTMGFSAQRCAQGCTPAPSISHTRMAAWASQSHMHADRFVLSKDAYIWHWTKLRKAC